MTKILCSEIFILGREIHLNCMSWCIGSRAGLQSVFISSALSIRARAIEANMWLSAPTWNIHLCDLNNYYFASPWIDSKPCHSGSVLLTEDGSQVGFNPSFHNNVAWWTRRSSGPDGGIYFLLPHKSFLTCVITEGKGSDLYCCPARVGVGVTPSLNPSSSFNDRIKISSGHFNYKY